MRVRVIRKLFEKCFNYNSLSLSIVIERYTNEFDVFNNKQHEIPPKQGNYSPIRGSTSTYVIMYIVHTFTYIVRI